MNAELFCREDSLLKFNPNLKELLLKGDFTEGWCQVEEKGCIGANPIGDVSLCSISELKYFPSSGLCQTSDGKILQAPALAMGSVFEREHKKTKWAKSKSHPAAAVWLGYAGRRNFGHFIFDSLTMLNYMRENGLLANFPPVSSGLTIWQKELLFAAGIDASSVIKLRGSCYTLNNAIYTTGINHYLHRCDKLLVALAKRFRDFKCHINSVNQSKKITYWSRSGYSGRIMVNEPRVEDFVNSNNRGG